jgi:hypothetical protein
MKREPRGCEWIDPTAAGGVCPRSAALLITICDAKALPIFRIYYCREHGHAVADEFSGPDLSLKIEDFPRVGLLK